MATAIRMSRGGQKHRPYYRIVVADTRAPRDGRYIERLGTYNPFLPKDSDQRVTLKSERIQYWLGQGAQPSRRVAIFLGEAGLGPKVEPRNNPNKAKPSDKTLERIKEKEEKAAAAKEAAEAAAAAPAEEAPAEAPAEEAAEAPAKDAAPVEEAKEEAPAEEKAEEAKAEESEAPAEDAKPEEEAKSEKAETPAKEEKKEG